MLRPSWPLARGTLRRGSAGREAHVHRRAAGQVVRLRGVRAIAISQPHFDGSMIELTHAFDAPVYIPKDDRRRVARSDHLVVFRGGDTRRIGDGLTWSSRLALRRRRGAEVGRRYVSFALDGGRPTPCSQDTYWTQNPRVGVQVGTGRRGAWPRTLAGEGRPVLQDRPSARSGWQVTAAGGQGRRPLLRPV